MTWLQIISALFGVFKDKLIHIKADGGSLSHPSPLCLDILTWILDGKGIHFLIVEKNTF